MEQSMLAWSIRALLMAAGTGVVVGLLRVRAAGALHRAWSAAMVAMLLLPAWTVWGPKVAAPLLPATVAPAVAMAIEAPMEAVGYAVETPQRAIAEMRETAGLDWRQVLLAIYLAGAAAMLARLIRGTLQGRSMMREARPGDEFATSPQCAAPVAIGWLRPVLLLPEGWQSWPAARLKAVLIHEREHVTRRDPLVQWLALLNRCVFWFHPLAWWFPRKLAELAEEACDTAVLARGVAPDEYADHLIELARAVNMAGARIRWAGSMGFATGNLPRRIRRIMEARDEARVSRARSVAAAGLCGLLLATFLACNLERSRPAKGQASMSEQGRREVQEAMQRQNQGRRVGQLVRDAAMGLTPERAKDLEADLKKHPDEPYELVELMRYYEWHKDVKAANAATQWYIAEHPDQRENWGQRPVWDRIWDQDGYERGKQLWALQLKKRWDGPFVYMNAAEYLSGNENEWAEQILLEGQRKFPSPALHWEVFLARHYAWALTGQTGQLSENRNVVRYDESDGPAPALSSYAQKVRASLLASKDTELLDRVVEQLQASGPNREFVQALIDRMLALQPDNRHAHVRRDNLQMFTLAARAKKGSLSDADRMALLVGWFGRSRGKDDPTELLALASRNPKDPYYGAALFLGHLALGDEAVKRGDKAGAVQHLRAAADAPVTDFLRYHQIDMSLPRKLVDAGERETVANFLDHCAGFNQTEPLKMWAAEIRKGINPRLQPDFSMSREGR
jgi:beta-lactamase regulating signal transducer with metallopeptidase domain